jgi:hypothetical protein
MKNDYLAVSNGLGSELLLAAKKEAQEKAKRVIIGQVEKLYSDISEGEGVIAEIQRKLSLLRRRIAAIEKGHFSIDHRSFQLRYNDEQLQRDVWS